MIKNGNKFLKLLLTGMVALAICCLIIPTAANKIVDGMSVASFAPDQAVTREQMVVTIYRFAGQPAAEGNFDKFADTASVSDYATDAFRWAVGIGLIGGVSDTELAPQGEFIRAQVAAVMQRYCEYLFK